MKIFALFLMSLLMVCCTKDDEVKAATVQEAGKTLVVYYSYTNNCHEIVTSLTSQIQTDVMRIKPADKTQKYEAHDYGNFEKVGPLGQSFPENNESITTEPGDIILYQGSNLCLYHDTNTWTFTRIGKIEGKTQAELKQILKAGQGNITVTLSLNNTTGISDVRSNAESGAYYSLNGQRIENPTKGLYIRNGKKIIL